MTIPKVKQYSDLGQLIFSHDQTAEVIYRIDEFVSTTTGVVTRRGHVSHAKGHPDWHPIIPLQPGPFTLVMLTSGN